MREAHSGESFGSRGPARAEAAVLQAEQIARFLERGVLSLPGAVDAERAAELRAPALAFLRSRAETRGASAPQAPVQAGDLAPIARAHGFAETWGGAVLGALDALLGAGSWQVPAHAGQILGIAFPEAGAWRLPHQSWHLDYLAPAAGEGPPGVQLFLCLDTVDVSGGATLVAAGIHRLVDALRRRHPADWPGRSSEVRRALARDVPWLRALLSERPGEDRVARFMDEPTVHGGVPLQVVALAGAPGDVFAVHPWALHAPSPNCGARPRLVLTERIRRTRAQPSRGALGFPHGTRERNPIT